MYHQAFTRFISLFGLFLFILGISACNKTEDCESTGTCDSTSTGTCNLATISESSEVMGYGILERVPGIWNGPVTSPTPLGSYPEWIVDFRPISASQVSAKNELDKLNDIFMSFFLVKHDCAYKMAFRNGGGFAGLVRKSYQLIDSVSESPTEAYYRFSDPVKGESRVYTDVWFRNDSLIMKVYTNRYNSLSEPEIHMHWRAKIQDTSSAAPAIAAFDYPQKELVKNFTETFEDDAEAIYFDASLDPYPETAQPYLGVATINVNITNPASPDPSKKVFILITTAPLFSGFIFQPEQLIYRSRYVFIDAGTDASYSFNYMHPGSYYINALYDSNGDNTFSSGDYVNSSSDIPFTLGQEGTVSKDVVINFEIP